MMPGSLATIEDPSLQQVYPAFKDKHYSGVMGNDFESPKGTPLALKICTATDAEEADALQLELSASMALQHMGKEFPHPYILYPEDVFQDYEHRNLYIVSCLAESEFPALPISFTGGSHVMLIPMHLPDLPSCWLH